MADTPAQLDESAIRADERRKTLRECRDVSCDHCKAGEDAEKRLVGVWWHEHAVCSASAIRNLQQSDHREGLT